MICAHRYTDWNLIYTINNYMIYLKKSLIEQLISLIIFTFF